MEPCPYARDKENGAHSFVFMIPENIDNPLTVVCERCASYAHIELGRPLPLDNLTADVIKAMARG